MPRTRNKLAELAKARVVVAKLEAEIEQEHVRGFLFALVMANRLMRVEQAKWKCLVPYVKAMYMLLQLQTSTPRGGSGALSRTASVEDEG